MLARRLQMHRRLCLPPDRGLSEFCLLTVADVTAVVRALLDKQFASDPLSIRLKDSIDILAPYFVEPFRPLPVNWLGTNNIQSSLHHTAVEEA